tara:strand:+ start:873 stop:1061 length:189 start_codon:yes stop_codon:yes gene_type:complete
MVNYRGTEPKDILPLFFRSPDPAPGCGFNHKHLVGLFLVVGIFADLHMANACHGRQAASDQV